MELVLNAVPVRRSPQNEHQSYLASMMFSDICRLLDRELLYVPNQPELTDFAQRRLNKARIKEIAEYIWKNYSYGTVFFPPICINAQPSPQYKDGSILLPYHSVTLRLTDGQHRCFGIRKALEEIEPQDDRRFLAQLEIGVLIYAGLPLEEERQAFRDQNLLVQRPNVSLSHYFDQRSPAVLIAKELLQRVPQFCNNVEQVENGLNQHNSKLMTLSTLVTATKYMFPHLKSKNNLESYIDWAYSFWVAAANNFPDNAWELKNTEERSQQRKESIAVSAVVFQAMGMLARELYQENVAAENLARWLVKLRKIDWQRKNQFWLERGVTQIGAAEESIISNTKTTVNACHKVLQEFVGVAALML